MRLRSKIRLLKVTTKYFFEGTRWYDALLREKKIKVDGAQYWYDEASKAALNKIRTFFEDNFDRSPRTSTFEGDVLVESLYEQAGSNYNNFLLAKLISHHSKPHKVHVLVNNEQDPSIDFWKGLSDDYHFIFLNREIPLIDRIRAIPVAWSYFQKTRFSLENGMDVSFEGRVVGDLIYDDLLRKSNLPTVRHHDLLMYSSIYYALLKYWAYKRIYGDYPIAHMVSTHDVYINWGLLFKACDESVRCWTWFGHEYFNVNCSQKNWITIRKPNWVTAEILNLFLSRGRAWINQEFEKLSEAEFGGKIVRSFDDKTVYSASAIETKDQFFEEFKSSIDSKRKNVFVFAHAFVDGVNKAHWRLFADYYTWIEETLIELSKNENVNVFVKPHPSERFYQCDVTVRDVVKRVNRVAKNKIVYLTKKVSNRLVLDIADAFVTSRGSISAQAPCFGKPSIVAAAVYTEEAKAVIQPRTITAYKNELKNIHLLERLDDETVTRAKAAYLYQALSSFSKTKLNAYKSPEWSRLKELNTVVESLSQIENSASDPLMIDFKTNFIDSDRRQTLDHRFLDELRCLPLSPHESPSV